MENASPYIITETIETLRDGLKTTGNSAFTNVTNQIQSQFEYDPKGHLFHSEQNEKVNQRIIDDLFTATQTQTLFDRVNKAAQSTHEIYNHTLSYFVNMKGNIDYDIQRQAAGTIAVYQERILAIIHSQNMSAEIIDPAQKALNKLISEGATENRALTLMENKIKERFESYIAPNIQMELEAFYRNLNNVFAEGLQLVWVRYIRQPSDAERRSFCFQYDFETSGRTYHIEEVKLWPNEHNHEWQGMYPGTNAANILQYAGGFNCLHSFEYVEAWQVNNADKEIAKSLGFI